MTQPSNLIQYEGAMPLWIVAPVMILGSVGLLLVIGTYLYIWFSVLFPTKGLFK